MDGPGYHTSTFTMVRGNIILAWQWSGTSTMVRRNIILAWQWSGTSAMDWGNIILAWQWSGTSIHIYRWPGISHLNIHNGPGHHDSSMAMVRDIRNGLGQHHTSMAMVRDIHSHLWMARDITAQHSQWSGARSEEH